MGSTSTTKTTHTKTTSESKSASSKSKSSSGKHTTATTSATHTIVDSQMTTSSASTLATSTGNIGLKSQATSILSEIVSDKNSLLPSATATSVPFSTSSPNAGIVVAGGSSSTTPSSRSSSAMPPGTIAGIVIGTIATALLLALVILLWLRMRWSRQKYGGIGSASSLEERSSPSEKSGPLITHSREMSSSGSHTTRPRSWSGGASKRFSHLPPIETIAVANVRPSPSRQSSWSVVKSPSHEHLVSSTTSLPSQVPGTRVLHSDTMVSPVERSLVSPMSSRMGDSGSLSVELAAPGQRHTVSPVHDESDGDVRTRLLRRSMGVVGNDRHSTVSVIEGGAAGNAKLKRSSQVARLKVIETKPEVDVETPMVSPLEEFHDSRQSLSLRTPSPAVDAVDKKQASN